MTTKRVSLDEYLHAKNANGVERKSFARDNGVVVKAAPTALVEKAKFDKEAGTIRFVMSAEVEDRDRDIVVQAGLNTAEFEKNPVAPWAHRSGNLPIGTWSDLEKNLTGRPKRTEGTLTLVKGDPQADLVALHFDAGSVRACSIGFMPTSIERREVPEDKKDTYFYPGYMIHEAELYECSPCSIPANPAALAKAAADGDVLSRELIEQVLDCWDLKDGVLVPRKAFEDSYRAGTRDRTIVTIGAKRFNASLNEKGEPSLSPVEVSPAERLAEDLEAAPGMLARFAKLLGLEPKEKPVEQAVVSQMEKDLPALQARHELLDAEAREAALDAQMRVHCPA